MADGSSNELEQADRNCEVRGSRSVNIGLESASSLATLGALTRCYCVSLASPVNAAVCV